METIGAKYFSKGAFVGRSSYRFLQHENGLSHHYEEFMEMHIKRVSSFTR